MRLSEALAILNSARVDAPEYPVSLVCGFTPLHLQTFVQASLQQRCPDRRVRVAAGLYGDLAGTLDRQAREAGEGAAVVLEWSDLDARLGIRSSGGWLPEALPDIERTVAAALDVFGGKLQRLGGACPVAVSLPTLPLAPVAFTPGWQTSGLAARLRLRVAEFAARLVDQPGLTVVNEDRLNRCSSPGARHDAKSELALGFPYRLDHAAVLAALLVDALRRPAPLKGLITDLDDTLWSGILGEVGVEGVTWSLEGHSQIHAVYQRVLASLAASGVLVGVASKNDPELVREAFARPDLLLRPENVFPIEAGWGAKSESVRSILARWNIGPGDVVFLDDSPIEVAEVQAAFPQMRCLRFPKTDPAAVCALVEDLRDWFGKSALSEEDRLRLASLRAQDSGAVSQAAGASVSAGFLASTEPRIHFDFEKNAAEPRAFELVNKTNQFNLNGQRYTGAEWRAGLAAEGAFLLTVSYTDKFGPLGRIAVVRGAVLDGRVDVGTWVMSCRAFARRIEHHCLRALFERFDAAAIVLDYRETPRNGPLRDFLRTLTAGEPAPGMAVTRADFEQHCRPLLEGADTPIYD
jgi:FkbH-like protein